MPQYYGITGWLALASRLISQSFVRMCDNEKKAMKKRFEELLHRRLVIFFKIIPRQKKHMINRNVTGNCAAFMK